MGPSRNVIILCSSARRHCAWRRHAWFACWFEDLERRVHRDPILTNTRWQPAYAHYVRQRKPRVLPLRFVGEKLVFLFIGLRGGGSSSLLCGKSRIEGQPPRHPICALLSPSC